MINCYNSFYLFYYAPTKKKVLQLAIVLSDIYVASLFLYSKPIINARIYEETGAYIFEQLSVVSIRECGSIHVLVLTLVFYLTDSGDYNFGKLEYPIYIPKSHHFLQFGKDRNSITYGVSYPQHCLQVCNV